MSEPIKSKLSQDFNLKPLTYKQTTKPKPILSMTPQERIMTEIENVQDLVRQENRGKISEEIFEKYFLPVFIDDLKGLKDNEEVKLHREKVLADWLLIANGSRHVEVDVVNTRGEILFTVPALSEGAKFSHRRDDHSVPISSIMNMASMLSAQSPQKGAYELDHGLGRHVIEASLDRKIPEHLLKKWQNIFDRYPNAKGVSYMEAERLAKLAPKEQDTQSTNNPDDLLDFD